MKKSKFILGVVAAIAAVTAMTGCELELRDADQRATESGYVVKSIAVTGATTSFVKGSAFSYDSAVVTATFADSSTADVTSGASFSVPDTSTVGTQTVTVSYAKTSAGIDCDAVSTTYDIEIVNIATSIVLTSGTVYTLNGGKTALPVKDSTFTVTFSDNSTTTVSASALTFGEVTSSDTSTYTVLAYYAGYPEAGSSISVTNSTSAKDLYNAGVSVSDLYNAGVQGTDLVEIAKDYTVGSSDLKTSWAPGTDYTLNAEEAQTLYLVNYGGTENYQNFLIEMFTSNSGITVRADNYGWNYGTSAGTDFDYKNSGNAISTTVTDWATWLSSIKDGALIKVVAEHSGSYITFTCTSNATGLEDWTQIYKIAALTETSQASIGWHINCDGSYMVILKDAE